VTRLGSENLVCGSDWAHLDIGADVTAHRQLYGQNDLDQSVRRRIVDTNARVLYNIDPAFRQSDTKDVERVPRTGTARGVRDGRRRHEWNGLDLGCGLTGVVTRPGQR
jgi:hypothetical protein